MIYFSCYFPLPPLTDSNSKESTTKEFSRSNLKKIMSSFFHRSIQLS